MYRSNISPISISNIKVPLYMDQRVLRTVGRENWGSHIALLRPLEVPLYTILISLFPFVTKEKCVKRSTSPCEM